MIFTILLNDASLKYQGPWYTGQIYCSFHDSIERTVYLVLYCDIVVSKFKKTDTTFDGLSMFILLCLCISSERRSPRNRYLQLL